MRKIVPEVHPLGGLSRFLGIAKFVELLFDFTLDHPFALGHADESHRHETPDGICDEIPTGILISADIGVGDKESREEFDDLIHGAKPHSGDGTKENDACGRVIVSQGRSQGLPADPCRNAESVSMDNVVVFEEIRDEPPTIEHIFFSIDGPGLRDRRETSEHVEAAPDTEAPECFVCQGRPTMNREDKDDEKNHHADIEGEFPVLVFQRKDCGDHHVGRSKRCDRVELREGGGEARHAVKSIAKTYPYVEENWYSAGAMGR